MRAGILTYDRGVVVEIVEAFVADKRFDELVRVPDRLFVRDVERDDVQRALCTVLERVQAGSLVGVSACRDDDVGRDGEQLPGEL